MEPGGRIDDGRRAECSRVARLKRAVASADEGPAPASLVLGALFLAYLIGLVGVAGAEFRSVVGLWGALTGALMLFTLGSLPAKRRRAVRRGARIALALTLALVAGAIRMDGRLAQAEVDRARAEVAASEGREALWRIEATVVGRTERRWGVEVELQDVRPLAVGGELPGHALLSLSGAGRRGRAHEQLWPGSRVQLVVRIEPLVFARNPGNPDRERAAAVRGYGARARLVDPDWVVVVGGGASPFAEAIRVAARWRGSVRDAVAARLAGNVSGAGLARALVLGDRRDLDSASLAAFRAMGLSHLVVISGLHVGIIVTLLFFANSMLGRVSRGAWRRRVGARRWSGGIAVAGGVVGAYAWLAGAGPSVLRAAFAVALLGIARTIKRDLSPMVALCLIGWIGVLVEPSLALDLGAQLSFAACAGIIGVLSGGASEGAFLGDPAASLVTRSRERLVRAAREGLLVSLAASFATAPLLVRSDLPLALGGPLANVIAVPLLAAFILPAAIGAVVIEGGLSGMEGELVEGIAAARPWIPTIWLLAPVAAFDASVRRLAEFAIGVPSIARSVEATLAGLAVAGWVMARRRRLGASALLWILVWSLSGGAPAPGRGDLASIPRIVFLDVGQGDATLIQGRTSAVLVDGGGGRPGPAVGAKVIRALRSLGVTRLDRLVVTHGDADHRAGAEGVLKAFDVGALWLPRGAEADVRLVGLATLAAERSVPVEWVSAGRLARVGEIELEVLWPDGLDGPGREIGERSSNEGSLVLVATVGEIRSLLTADVGSAVERVLIRDRRNLAADILKVGHHGSQHGTLPEFLDAVRPGVAVLSAPCRPHRGLPHARVIAALEDRAIPMRWTGRSGAVSIGLDTVREAEATEPPFRAASGRGFIVREWGPARNCLAAEASAVKER